MHTLASPAMDCLVFLCGLAACSCACPDLTLSTRLSSMAPGGARRGDDQKLSFFRAGHACGENPFGLETWSEWRCVTLTCIRTGTSFRLLSLACQAHVQASSTQQPLLGWRAFACLHDHLHTTTNTRARTALMMI